MIRFSEADLSRFWKYVVKFDFHGTGCWLWGGAKWASNRGYGMLLMHGKRRPAHHVAWAVYNDRWPVQRILHSCDNEACVNPYHLREGTQKENVADCVTRGRHACLRKGAQSNRSKKRAA